MTVSHGMDPVRVRHIGGQPRREARRAAEVGEAAAAARVTCATYDGAHGHRLLPRQQLA